MSTQEKKGDVVDFADRTRDPSPAELQPEGHTKAAAHAALILAILAIMLTIGLFFHEQATDKTLTSGLAQTQEQFAQRMDQTEQQVQALSQLPETIRQEAVRLALEEMSFSVQLLKGQLGDSPAGQDKLARIQGLIKDLRSDLASGGK